LIPIVFIIAEGGEKKKENKKIYPVRERVSDKATDKNEQEK
jgi:hypothetical protein